MQDEYDPLRQNAKKEYKKNLRKRMSIIFFSILAIAITIQVLSYIFGFDIQWLFDLLDRLSFDT
ncbi:membrane protein YdbS with pleckstrin-like domain [Geomicrobium halophilum]|uniref:Membrane protein YdbS with pleckstrin-like domain n=1 Tax=Geomicrobium halophilum TaxID=549000 RepID=A0A841PZA5_9BACL|nr:hypothetical protein [Geomicrobium halophilum]MBB6450223.1 membrane protein YdbS with pleckstrin-like domain [Geomicrobium halophilum]